MRHEPDGRVGSPWETGKTRESHLSLPTLLNRNSGCDALESTKAPHDPIFVPSARDVQRLFVRAIACYIATEPFGKIVRFLRRSASSLYCQWKRL